MIWRAPGGGPGGPLGSAPASPRHLLAAGFVLLLACFAGKPPHMDDPLFLWAARHILDDPWRPYGLLVNWYGVPAPLHEVMQNPPLVAYVQAGLMRLFGDSVVPLHLAFLAFPYLLALGCWELAARFCSRPAPAVLLALGSPAALVAGTSLMSDIPMLACWVWGVAFWLRGQDRERPAWFAAAALTLGLGVLCKYYVAATVPLLAAYTLARERRLRPRLLFLALPLAVLAGYGLLSARVYGVEALGQAVAVSLRSTQQDSLPYSALLATLFLGGALVPAAAFLPLLGGASGRPRLAAFALVLSLGLGAAGSLRGLSNGDPLPWWGVLEGGLFLAGGAHLLALAAGRAWRERSADALLLALAVLGPWLFALRFNWCVNARALLPAAPFLGILLVRSWEAGPPASRTPARRALLAAALALSLAVGLAVAWADARWAASAHAAAAEMARRFPPPERARVHFLGHWGFQYAMEREGFPALDVRGTRFAAGEALVIPANNLDHALPWELFDMQESLRFPACSFATLRTPTGFAGFHSSNNGPLPYLLGPAEPELYVIARARHEIQFQ